jgi:hypothetical protein
MPSHIFLFNGPAYSGKNTLLEHLFTRSMLKIDFIQINSIDPIKQIVQSFTTEYIGNYTKSRAEKEAARPEFFGLSYREFAIKISEEWLKPSFGADCIGKMFARKCVSVIPHNNCIIANESLGFNEELFAILKELKPHVKALDIKVHLIKVSREGCTYDGDSREDVDANSLFLWENELTAETADPDYLASCWFAHNDSSIEKIKADFDAYLDFLKVIPS